MKAEARGAIRADLLPHGHRLLVSRSLRTLSWAPHARFGGPLPRPRASLHAPRAHPPHGCAAHSVVAARLPLRDSHETSGESSPSLRRASLTLPGAAQESTGEAQVSTRASSGVAKAALSVPSASPRAAGDAVPLARSRSAHSWSLRPYARRVATQLVRRFLIELVLSPFASSRSVFSLCRLSREWSRPFETSRFPTRSASLPLSKPRSRSSFLERPSEASSRRHGFPRVPIANRARPHALLARRYPLPAPRPAIHETLSLRGERRGELPAPLREHREARRSLGAPLAADREAPTSPRLGVTRYEGCNEHFGCEHQEYLFHRAHSCLLRLSCSPCRTFAGTFDHFLVSQLLDAQLFVQSEPAGQ